MWDTFNTLTTYDVVLPAGGYIPDDFAEKVGTNIKALIEFEGKTILERTLTALKESGRIKKTVVVGTDPIREHSVSKLVDTVLPSGPSGAENMFLGVKHLLAQPNPPTKVMVVAADLPFLNSAMINSFLDACPSGSHICVPLVSKPEWDQRFPESSATFVRLKDNSWTAGCVYLFDTAAMEKAMPKIEGLFQNRKSIPGMAKLLGPKFLFKVLMKSLTIPDVEQKVQDMLGITGTAIRNSAPELSYDIDDFTDYEYAMRTQVHVN